jgi:hypothetical protein
MIEWLAHIVLRQLRLDVIGMVFSLGEVQPEKQERASEGLDGFSHDYLSSIMTYGEVYLTSGNKTTYKKVSGMFKYLFRYNDGVQREHWDDKPYRILIKRAEAIFPPYDARYSLTKNFHQMLYRCLLKFHWILPYPGPLGLTQITKGKGRIWYLIIRDSERRPQWGKKSYWEGLTDALPLFITWNKARWQDWIE